MDTQQFINTGIGMLTLVIGWLWKVIGKLFNRVGKLEVLVAGDYVKREEINEMMKSVHTKLDKITDLLIQR